MQPTVLTKGTQREKKVTITTRISTNVKGSGDFLLRHMGFMQRKVRQRMTPLGAVNIQGPSEASDLLRGVIGQPTTSRSRKATSREWNRAKRPLGSSQVISREKVSTLNPHCQNFLLLLLHCQAGDDEQNRCQCAIHRIFSCDGLGHEPAYCRPSDCRPEICSSEKFRKATSGSRPPRSCEPSAPVSLGIHNSSRAVR